jgi:uncharacterized membrane protein YeiB
MGFGIASAPALRRLPTWALLAAACTVLGLTPFVQDWLNTPGALNNPRMAGWIRGTQEVVSGGHLRLAAAEGQFPIFPWLSLYIVGLAAGRWIHERNHRPITWLTLGCLGLGGAAAIAWAAGLQGARLDVLERTLRINVPFFPASPTEALLLLGAVLLAVRIGLLVDERRELSSRGPLVVLGRASLTLLLLHVVVFREATRPIDVWQNLSPSAALTTMIGFIFLAAIAAWRWQKIGYRYGAEWMLRKMAP